MPSAEKRRLSRRNETAVGGGTGHHVFHGFCMTLVHLVIMDVLSCSITAREASSAESCSCCAGLVAQDISCIERRWL